MTEPIQELPGKKYIGLQVEGVRVGIRGQNALYLGMLLNKNDGSQLNVDMGDLFGVKYKTVDIRFEKVAASLILSRGYSESCWEGLLTFERQVYLAAVDGKVYDTHTGELVKPRTIVLQPR